MAARIALGLTALFWVTMNVLLWREEYGARDAGADAVPVDLVWKKILTAPDPSSLSIWQGEKRIGFAHWITAVGEEMAELEDAPPEDVGDKVKSYQLKLDGNVMLPSEDLRLRFESSMKLSAEQAWQEFSLRVISRPMVWQINASAAEKNLRFQYEDGSRRFSRVLTMADLQNPQKLLNEFAGPAGFGLLSALGLPALNPKEASATPGMTWEARSTHLTIGHEPIRVYRLQTRLLDRFTLRIFVSRAGEILRVELPNGIILKHDQISVRATATP
jgi:hypothetical protein